MDKQTKRHEPDSDGYEQNGNANECIEALGDVVKTWLKRMDQTSFKKARTIYKRKDKERWSSGNVEQFLAFEPTEIPKWREDTMTKDAPCISQMLKDIVMYKERYQQLKNTSKEDGRKKILEDLLVRFLCTIQREEDIGVKEERLTKSLMKDLDESSNGTCSMSKDVKKKPQCETFRYERSNSLELPSIELDQLGNIGATLSERGATPAKITNETINLYKGYKHIKDEILKAFTEKGNGDAADFESDLFSKPHDVKGFIEVESLIKHTHRILMTGVMPEGTTPPGQFSIFEREAEFNGKIYRYPRFQNEAAAEHAVQTLVDKVNDIVENIKQKDASEEQKAKLFFKCSSMFLFCFLTLHPFGDGNGRLARLLSSYNLLTFSPFLTPIYNVFSASRQCDYIQALIDAREGLDEGNRTTTSDDGTNCDNVQTLIDARDNHVEGNPITTRDEAINLTISLMHKKPSDLCSMLIESNWTVWRQLLKKLGDKDIKLYSWEEKNSTS